MSDPASPVPAPEKKWTCTECGTTAVRDERGWYLCPKCDLWTPVPATDDIEEMLDRFEGACVDRAVARQALHSAEAWVTRAEADYPTESFLLAADANSRSARSEILALVSRLRSQVERMKADSERIRSNAPHHTTDSVNAKCSSCGGSGDAKDMTIW